MKNMNIFGNPQQDLFAQVKTTSLDITDERIEALKQLFPAIVTDGKIDWGMLKTMLGESLEKESERYKFSWNGKNSAIMEAQTVSSKTLVPDIESSKNWENTENLYIEGDNLEVLKILQNSYNGKIKMIYIDPPYNTGSDFIYEDDFVLSQEEMEENEEIKDKKGTIRTLDRLQKNDKGSAKYHTNWLNMMYPRLSLARDLLTDDGVIFISIDDNEVHNLRKICDEIFGESNFINILSVKMKNIAGASGGGEDKKLKKNIEYLLAYTKNYEIFENFKNAYEYTEMGELVQQYRESNISWKYTTILYYEGDKEYVGSTIDGDGNEIKIFSRKNAKTKSISQIMKEENISEIEAYNKYATKIFQTAMPQSSIRPRVMKKVQELGVESEMYSIEYIPKSGKNKGCLYEQFYKGDKFRLFAWLKDVSEEIDGKLYKKDLQGTFWDYVADTKNLTKEGNVIFQNGKKPLAMIKRIIEISTDEDSIIMDFFSGSATTAHAVMQLNMEDGGKRRYILVQLPEVIDENSENYEKDCKTICEIGIKRIGLAGDKILSENPESNIDIGFKVFKVETSNIKEWDTEYESVESSMNLALSETLSMFKDGRSPLDIVYELILKERLPLTSTISSEEINDSKLFNINEGMMYIYLGELNNDVVKRIIELKNESFDDNPKVILDESKLTTEMKSNAKKTFDSNGIKDVRTI